MGTNFRTGIMLDMSEKFVLSPPWSNMMKELFLSSRRLRFAFVWLAPTEGACIVRTEEMKPNDCPEQHAGRAPRGDLVRGGQVEALATSGHGRESAGARLASQAGERLRRFPLSRCRRQVSRCAPPSFSEGTRHRSRKSGGGSASTPVPVSLS